MCKKKDYLCFEYKQLLKHGSILWIMKFRLYCSRIQLIGNWNHIYTNPSSCRLQIFNLQCSWNYIASSVFRLLAKKHMGPWELLLEAEQEINKLVFSQTDMLQSIWTTQIRKCFILCRPALDLVCIQVLLREPHHLSQMIFGMASLPERIQVKQFQIVAINNLFLHTLQKNHH